MGEESTRGEGADTNHVEDASSGWVTTQQAARALGIRPRTVRWHIVQGNLDARTEGEGVRRAWLVSIDSLQAFRAERQAAGELPRDSRAAEEHADIAAETPGSSIRELADRLVEEAARAAEYRVRLEITEQAQSTLEEKLQEERRRREEAERAAEELRRQLEALRAPQSAAEASEGTRPPDAGDEAREATERPQEQPRRSWWREFFGFGR